MNEFFFFNCGVLGGFFKVRSGKERKLILTKISTWTRSGKFPCGLLVNH